jgi:hypothetical protein
MYIIRYTIRWAYKPSYNWGDDLVRISWRHHGYVYIYICINKHHMIRVWTKTVGYRKKRFNDQGCWRFTQRAPLCQSQMKIRTLRWHGNWEIPKKPQWGPSRSEGGFPKLPAIFLDFPLPCLITRGGFIEALGLFIAVISSVTLAQW